MLGDGIRPKTKEIVEPKKRKRYVEMSDICDKAEAPCTGQVSWRKTRGIERLKTKEKRSKKVYAKSGQPAAGSEDAVANVQRIGHGHVNRGKRCYVEDAVLLFFRPKIVRVRLLSRPFFSEASFFADRPEWIDLESETVAPSSMYLSL
jgi:hypothetical protein